MRRPTFTALGVAALGIAALGGAATPLGAQQGTGSGSSSGGSAGQRSAPRAVRITVNGQPRSLNSACAELAASPTPLRHAPEGRALLRYKKDLEGAAAVIDQRGEGMQRFEIRRMSEVQRGLDSLMQVMVKTIRADSLKGPAVITLRGQNGDVLHLDTRATRGQVQAELRSLQPRIAAIMEDAGRRTMVRASAPAGWMGVQLSQSVREVVTPEGMLTHFCEYPVVETVTAGSPAEKAGMQAGDTLLAYNGRDLVSQAVNHATLFVPNRVVRVRVRRDGRTRELPVTIAARPHSTTVFVRTACTPGGRCEAVADRRDTLRTFRFGPVERPLTATTREELEREYFRSTLPPLPMVEPLLQGTGMGLLFGARLSVVDETFAENNGTRPGVLVLGVSPGTPAAAAGLRPGEVILAVNGVPLREMAPLRRAFDLPGVREVKLTVAGKDAAPRIVTVKR